MTYSYRHRPGYSAYDHYASEVISCAYALTTTRSRRAMEQVLLRAWHESRPPERFGRAVGPRIDVVCDRTRS